MPELLLKFTDEYGEAKKILVKGEKFEIGRHSESDLSLANSAVSRQHLKIELFSHIYTVTDVGSTLGTTLNGEKLDEPKVLKNGDILKLGDSLKIEIVLDESEENAEDEKKNSADNVTDKAVSTSVTSSSTATGGGIPNSFFYLAPLFGLVVLIGVGGLFFFSGNAKTTGKNDPEKDEDFIYSTNRRKTSDDAKQDYSDSNDEITQTSTPEINSAVETPDNDLLTEISTPENSDSLNSKETPTPKNSDDLSKIEINSALFLRKVAQNDPKAFLTGGQQQIVKSRIESLKNSAALAANIRSAKANAARITGIANAKNVKPQLLAVAAIAKLGNTQGDVAATAQSMAGVLDEMSSNVGTELADDALLTIASYDQGAAGRTLEMRNMLQGLQAKFPGSSRRIRTIWFLKEKSLISDAQFQSAINFLAVGTISQNPKDFGISADALNL